MEKIVRNSLTKREIEIMILGEISSQTKNKYDETKHFILQTFEKEGIEKIKNEKGSFTKVNAKTMTVAELIKEKEKEYKKLQDEIKQLKTLNKNTVLLVRNEYATRTASKETKEKAKEYIDKILQDFTSKSLKQ